MTSLPMVMRSVPSIQPRLLMKQLSPTATLPGLKIFTPASTFNALPALCA